MSKSPAAIVKEQFGDKAKLVAALGPFTHDDLWVNRVNETKGLSRVSNAKLLRLFNVLSAVKETFGNRFKLVDAICEIEKRTKDEGFKKRLLAYPVPRLFDAYRAAAHRAGVTDITKTASGSRASAKGEAGTPKAATAKATPTATKAAGAKAPAKAAPTRKPAAKGGTAKAPPKKSR
jgi:hypothetical protein